jgi:hypothetical protein
MTSEPVSDVVEVDVDDDIAEPPCSTVWMDVSLA